MDEKKIKKELRDLINKNGIDSELNCADFILADYLYESLVSLDKAFRLNLEDYENFKSNLVIKATEKKCKNIKRS